MALKIIFTLTKFYDPKIIFTLHKLMRFEENTITPTLVFQQNKNMQNKLSKSHNGKSLFCASIISYSNITFWFQENSIKTTFVFQENKKKYQKSAKTAQEDCNFLTV